MKWTPLLAGFVLLAAPLTGCISTGTGDQAPEGLETENLVRGIDSPITERALLLARNASEWNQKLSALWAEHVDEGGIPDRPVVNFTDRMVVVVFAGGYPDQCAAVDIASVTHHSTQEASSGEETLLVEARVLALDDPNTECHGSSPVHAVTVPQRNGTPVFNVTEQTVDTLPEPWAEKFREDGETHESREGHTIEQDTGAREDTDQRPGIPFETVDKGADSRIHNETNVVVRTQDVWKSLWANHTTSDRPLPTIDFEHRMVIALFAGQAPDACHGIEVSQVHERDDGSGLLVRGSEQVRTHGACSQQVTHPFEIIQLDRYDGEVVFEVQRI